MPNEVEVSMGPLRRDRTWSSCGKDFANMLKAFIGSNYLTIAFAFHQSGFGLGLAGLLLIASLTAYCCSLLVKCKYHAIVLLMLKTQDDGNTQRNSSSSQGEKIPSSSMEKSSEDEDNSSTFSTHLLRTVSFGDVGRLCFGKIGLALVNVSIVITQFGFCIGYCIFIGNTIHSMFPLYNCSVPVRNSSKPTLTGDPQQCVQVKTINFLHTIPVDISNLTVVMPGVQRITKKLHVSGEGWLGHTASLHPYPIPSAVDDSIPLWLSGNATTINSDSSQSSRNISAYSEITKAQSTRNALTTSPAVASLAATENVSVSPTTLNSTTAPTDISTTSFFNTTFSPTVNTTTSIPMTNLTRWVLTRGKHVPDLKLLVLMPVPFFILTALIRNLRKIGWISLVANGAILIGCGEVLYFLIHGFVVSDSFQWVNWRGLPIFFGLVTSSFEGIGTILPIEASMEGNRHNFTKYLYAAVTFLAVVLISFGTLGYLQFGDNVQQMINANIPNSGVINILVNVSLCVGVLLTFPLMLFPVIDLTEIFFFSSGHLCTSKCSEEMDCENQSLLPKKEFEADPGAGDKIPRSTPGWKRNILRILLVLCTAGFAVALRNYFAYIIAFIGALGSTMLAFILPCLFHLKLCWTQLPLPLKIKDITIIIIGVFCGIAGMYSVVHEIIG